MVERYAREEMASKWTWRLSTKRG